MAAGRGAGRARGQTGARLAGPWRPPGSRPQGTGAQWALGREHPPMNFMAASRRFRWGLRRYAEACMRNCR